MPWQIDSPRPGALADGLGGEERLEDARADVLRDPLAGVLDVDAHVTAGGHRAGDADLVRRRVAGLDGVGGVDDEVQEHLPEARSVALHHRQLSVGPHHPSAVVDLVARDGDGTLQHALDVHRADMILVAAGERLHVTHDGRDARHALHRVGHGLLDVPADAVVVAPR
ncbi:MAG: hypothetical protein WKG00_04030 [Polyangiaceae bacterium]